MSASAITEKNCEEIQAAMAISLMWLKSQLGLTYSEIGRVIEREKSSVHQYICDTTDMPAACWLKAVAKWPELADRLAYNLDEAEKAFRARQRELRLPQPMPEERAA
jgi:hypothetical protein